MLTDFSTLMYTVSVWVLPALTAITLHEAAHGWVAWRLGDDTARRGGGPPAPLHILPCRRKGRGRSSGAAAH